MVSEYKHIYEMTVIDDEVVEPLPIPLEVAKDMSIKSYKVMEGDKVVGYYERATTKLDKPAKVEQGSVIEKPVFLGRWEDKTEEYLAEHPEGKKVNRSARARTEEEIKHEELLKAQRMLAELLLNGGGIENED